MPTPEQVAQVKSNVNNLMDFTNHVHDYMQDVIQEVYLKLSQDPSYDPMQKFVTNLMDAAFWSIGEFDFPGAGVISSFLGTFFGAYAGPDTPPSLAGTFGDVWARFDATFLQANSDLSVIYADPASSWDSSYVDPVTGKTAKVSDLGDGTTTMPGKDDPKFQQMTDSVISAYRYQLTKSTIGRKWRILDDPKGCFMAHWTDADVASWGHGFIAQNKAFYLRWHKDTGGNCCPIPGLMLLEDYLGSGSTYYFGGQASDDMCNWLFQDDQFGTVTNPNGIASRKDVFENWGLGSLLAAPAPAPEPTPAVEAGRARWRKLFEENDRQDLERKIARKAWADPLYMRDLVRRPREVLAAELGMVIPEDAKVEVVQELPNDYKLVIPWVGRPEGAG